MPTSLRGRNCRDVVIRALKSSAQRSVVTGASGFVGGRLVAHLRSRGIDAQGWARTGDVTHVDLLDAVSVRSAMAHAAPEWVFHLAAAGVTPERFNDPGVITENVVMTENVVGAAHACPSVRAIVIAGSASEYGASTKALSEEQDCHPTTQYGLAKLAATRAALRSLGGAKVRVARLFGLYGPGEPQHRLFPSLLAKLRAGEALPLSDGLQRRDFVHVDDACEMMIRMARLQTSRSLLVNVGTGVAVSIREVAEWVADALGASRDLLHFGVRARAPSDLPLLLADTTRCRALLETVPPQRLVPGLDPVALFQGPGFVGSLKESVRR